LPQLLQDKLFAVPVASELKVGLVLLVLGAGIRSTGKAVAVLPQIDFIVKGIGFVLLGEVALPAAAEILRQQQNRETKTKGKKYCLHDKSKWKFGKSGAQNRKP